MKKLLAIFLAVTMIATFIPSAFAVEGEGEQIEVKCDLGNLLAGYGSTVSLSQLNTDSNGIFKYVRSSLTTATTVKDGVYATEAAASGNTIKVAGIVPNLHLRIFGGRYICFEITVPKNGVYSLTTVSQKNTQGQPINVYMTDAATYYAQGTFAIANLGEIEGTINCYDSTSSYSDITSGGDWELVTVFENKTLAAGRYVITFQGAGQTGVSSPRAPLGTFTLSGYEVKEPEPSGIIIKYDIENTLYNNGLHVTEKYTRLPRTIDYNMTNGFFRILNNPQSYDYASTATSTHHFIKLKEGNSMSFEINVPVGDTYSLKTDYQKAKDGTLAEVYIDNAETAVATYDCSGGTSNMSANGTTWEENATIAENLMLTAGTHEIRFNVPVNDISGDQYVSIDTFELITEAGEGTVDMGGAVKVIKSGIATANLTVGDTATVSAAAYLSNGSVDESKTPSGTYTSSDTSVVTVSGTTITAVGAGTADITTTVGDTTAKRTITVVDKAATGEATVDGVTFYANSNVDGGITVTIPEIEYEIGTSNSDIVPGTKITLNATDIDGYVFRGWKRGSAADGVFVSSDTTYSFPLLSNTAITAIYEAKSETSTAPSVEFYNFNGQFIKSEDATGKDFSQLKPEEKDNPTVTGYNFAFWTTDGKNPVVDTTTFDKLTRVMAKFSVATTTYVVTIGNGITGAENGSYPYDTELSLSANEGGTWYVNNKPVAYGNAYNHYVFGAASITFEAGQNSGAPIISLDTATGGAKMISYDANAAEIVEVGILFGKEADAGKPTLGSFGNGKAASKKTGKGISGQFTATGNDGTSANARGYLIYNDNGTYRVIYAD